MLSERTVPQSDLHDTSINGIVLTWNSYCTLTSGETWCFVVHENVQAILVAVTVNDEYSFLVGCDTLPSVR